MHTPRFFLAALAGLVLAGLGLLAQAAPVHAAPAAPGEAPLTQPDGTVFTARAWGDERMRGWETLDGYTIVLDERSGCWVYAAASGTRLSPALTAAGAPLVVGRSDPGGLEQHARPAPPAFPPVPAPGAVLLGENHGAQPLLAILVDYNTLHLTHTAAEFHALLFGEAAGSARHFYRQASFWASSPATGLDLVPAQEWQGAADDGIVMVRLGGLRPDYVEMYLNSNETAAAALEAADASVNFQDYDTDGDGYITSAELHLLFVIAGFESSFCFRASDCPDPALDGVTLTWAHHTTLETPLQLDGKVLGGWSPPAAGSERGGYAMIGERHGTSLAASYIATLGVVAHELGHDLGWPDLYDPYFYVEGVGMWSLMGSGMWNGFLRAGDTPALPDAFSKWYQGWITPTPAADGQSYDLADAGANPGALLLGSNPGGVDWDFLKRSGTGEYWLVENRQQAGYDAGLPGCGLLIWHVDETRTFDIDANADPDRPLVDLVQADGRRDLNQEIGIGNSGDAGDPYPGSTDNREFSSLSDPRAAYYSGTLFQSKVTIDSAACAASMSVSVAEYVLPPQDRFTYLPQVMRLLPYSGRATYRGAPAAWLTVSLMARDSWGNIAPYASAVTDAGGNYTFTNPPSLTQYSEFQVTWTNPGSASGTLAAWYCDPVTGQPGDQYTCSFDIADAALTAPANGAAVSLPVTFSWSRRAAASDSYQVNITGPGVGEWYASPLLGYTAAWTMGSLPPEIPAGTACKWFLYIFGPNGYGEQQGYRTVTFR